MAPIIIAVLSCVAYAACAQRDLIVHIPVEDTYLLPRPFNNTFTQPFIDTNVSDQSFLQRIEDARNSAFISYSTEFDNILGPSPTVHLIANSSKPFAFEAGIWVPELNQIWVTAFLDPPPGYLSILDLNTSTVFQPELTGPAASVPVNPNGGYYFNGLVYLTPFGNETTSPAIVSIDPYTYETKEIVNSFYGLSFNGHDDVALTTSKNTGESCIFFSDFYFAAEWLPGTWSAPQQLPNAVWKFMPQEQSLQTAVCPLDIQTPNGLAVNREGTLLYVSDGPDSAVFSKPYNITSSTTPSAGLYIFNLAGEDGCTPQNKRFLGIARQGFANGIKIDDSGRIWTFEYEGIVVRSPTGKVLGLINVYAILGRESPDVAPGASFALVRDEVYLLGFYGVWRVGLGEVVKSWF